MARRPEAPTPTVSSAGRWLAWFGWGAGAAVGVLFAVVGASSVANGDERAWFPLLFGALLACLFIVQLIGYRLVRKPTAPATAAGAGIVLPLRPGHAPRQAATAILLGALPVPLALVEGTPTMWVVSGATVALGLLAAWWLAGPAARATRVHLDPDGVTVPRGLTSNSRIAWRDVRSVDLVPGWQPTLVLQSSDEDDLVGFRLLPQGWPPEQLRDVLAHFARNGKDRAALTSPQGVERFLS